jgi:hypothetical protein
VNKSNPELARLDNDANRLEDWRRWGPYLSERQWGTVREDYSHNGDAWNHFPHDHAHTRAYRWGEDGLLGICDRRCRLAFAIALWNGKDPILKERLFGLTNPEGNHGEDAKEHYYYLDSTPTHSYLKGLYKYPQAPFPYDELRKQNAARSKTESEFELHHTGVFDTHRYFDVFVEYAKASPEDILIRITIWNRGDETAELSVLPKLWFRNTWNWGNSHEAPNLRPQLRASDGSTVLAEHETLGRFLLRSEQTAPQLFTENETNTEVLYGSPNRHPVAKDAFHRAVIHGDSGALRARAGTKAAFLHKLRIKSGDSAVIRLRLNAEAQDTGARRAFESFDEIFKERRNEADGFYAEKIPNTLSQDQTNVVRQAYAGLLWSKQYYQFIVPEWVKGDEGHPPPPLGRGNIRNGDWRHFHASNVLSMPDKWEYPWFAAWDLAFHMLPMAKIDPSFAKAQLELILREWFMHPSGQIPAYEWNFNDVNPPVHAWAC